MTHELSVKKREISGKGVTDLREAGFVPGVIYGPEVEGSIIVQIEDNVFKKLYAAAGESSLVDLKIEGEKEPREVLIKKVDNDVVKGHAVHVDFYQIKRGQKLDVEAEIIFEGEAPAVKELNGVLVRNLDTVSLRCLPKDLISSVTVNLSVLKTFDDKIQVKDLKLSDEIEIMQDLEETIVGVSEPRVEEVDEAPVVEGEGEEGEAAEGGEEKPAEGGEEKPAEGDSGEKKSE